MAGTDLTHIDGVDVMTATTILSEAGWDMIKWKDEDHFVYVPSSVGSFTLAVSKMDY